MQLDSKLKGAVAFVDLKAQYASIKEELGLELDKVFKQTDFILGQAVSDFEASFAEFCDSKYCLGVASGTDALHLALRALTIGEGDEVITSANTFVATALAITYTRAKPVLVDIDPDNYNIDLDKIEEKITPQTKAIIPVHLYGRPVDMGSLLHLAERYDLSVVEDACQAHGAIHAGRKCGSFGRLGCFSFYPGKNLGAYGDGGAITTSDEQLYRKLKMLRNYGSAKKYYHEAIGYNSRLDSLQAAILKVKLKYLDQWSQKRFENAEIYNQKLQGVGDIITPQITDPGAHVFHLYVIRTKRRDELKSYLNKSAVQCGIHYPVPIYSLGAYAQLNLDPIDFPVTEEFSKQILSLPMHPELTEQQIERVVKTIKEFFND